MMSDDPITYERERPAGLWRAMTAYGVFFSLSGIGLALWDAQAETGDVNDIFDTVGILMAASGALVGVTGWRAVVHRPSVWLLAAVFFLHVGPTFTFGIYALIFYVVT
jgi:hypothetical protein